MGDLAAALHPRHGTLIMNLHGSGPPAPSLTAWVGGLLGRGGGELERRRAGYDLDSLEGRAIRRTGTAFRWIIKHSRKFMNGHQHPLASLCSDRLVDLGLPSGRNSRSPCQRSSSSSGGQRPNILSLLSLTLQGRPAGAV